VARRWADPSAFRPDPSAAPSARPSWRQSIALIAALVVVAGVVSTVSYLVRPDRARSFDLLHGAVLIGDQFGPVSVDLGSGKGTLQLRGADQQAGVSAPGDLALVPFDGATLLLNRKTGEFNMVDATGFVMKRDGGVTIGGQSGDTTATGVAAGQLAYIVRTGSTGTDVLLVGQATVATAAASPKTVKPRASYTLDDQAVTAEGGTASANGDLWALFRTANNTTLLRRFTLPPNSSTGATLRASSQGTVNAVSALESATTGADGSDDDVLGVASPGRVRIIDDNLKSRTVTYRAPAGLDSIVTATSAQGRLSYLLHGTDGWSVLSVRTDGTDLVGPTALPAIDPNAQLAPAAESLGSLYTMLRSGSAGTVYRIQLDGKVTAAEATYPQKTNGDGRSLESASFADGYLIARDSRVVVDSPGHYLALTIFTDGSHKPQVIEKSNLTSVNAANGADALTEGPADSKPTSAPTGAPKQTVAPQINNKINCKQVNQKPHVPQIASVDPAARSVGLSWTYPIISSQDCEPSTYVVSVKLISNNAPPAPGSVTLQGHLDTVLAGLYPNTQYEITVIAYINGQATPSLPVRVTTGKEGPAAPKNIKVTADSAGNWSLSWDGCGSVANKCVPTQSWTVKPYICDSHGLAASPASMTSPADPTSVAQPTAVYKGGDALLGRSLEFRIQGTGEDGTVGDVSAASACVQSWSPPIAGDMSLHASQPANTTLGDTTSTKVNLSLGADPTRTVGGVGSKVTFTLSGGGTTKSQSVTYSGGTSELTTSFGGIRAGTSYTVSAVVSAPGHSESSVTLPSVPVSVAADWPKMGLSAQCVTGGGLIQLTCDLTVQISGLSSSDAPGERFNIVDTNRASSELRCGNGPAQTLDRDSIDPQQPITINNLSLFNFNGSCTVTVVLQERTDSSTPVFGGVPNDNPPLRTTFTVGQATTYSPTSNDFSAKWDPDQSDSEALIAYTGAKYTVNQLKQITQNWTVTVIGPDSQNCGSRSFESPPDGVDVPASGACVKSLGGSDQWSVKITYQNVNGDSDDHSIPGNFSLGAPPSYQPCNVDQSQFGASWGATRAAGVTVTYGGEQSDISGCANFQYQLTKTPDGDASQDCGDFGPAQTAPASTNIQPTCAIDPAGSWSVHITWDNTNTGESGLSDDVSLGTPPKP